MIQLRKKSTTTGSRPRKATSPARETRTALMEAAQTHFSESGFKAASVHDIAKDAGVNVSLVSYHFGGKEGLFKACFEVAGTDRLQIAERVLASKPTNQDDLRIRLSMFIDEMLIDGVKNPKLCTILHRELDAEFHLIEDIFKKTFLKVFLLLSDFLREAKVRGILADWIDPDLIAIQLTGSVIHVLKADHVRVKIFGSSILDPAVLASTRDHILRSHLEGILAHK